MICCLNNLVQEVQDMMLTTPAGQTILTAVTTYNDNTDSSAVNLHYNDEHTYRLWIVTHDANSQNQYNISSLRL